MRPLNRHPAYQQLNDALRQLIASGEFAAGAKFITERDIATRFGVSRATANKALSNLVSEQILEFKPGIGTFVRGGVLDYNLKRLVSFTDRALAAGKKPETRVLQCRRISACELPDDAALALSPEPQQVMLSIERLRLADGLPVILERRYFAADFAPNMGEQDLAGSLYAYWSEQCGLNITGAEQVIRAVNMNDQDAELLKVPPQSAGLLVIATGFVDSEHPLWHERTLYRADAYEFHTSLGAWRAARPAVGCFSTSVTSTS